MICQMCGTANGEGAESCSACGSPLSGEAKQPKVMGSAPGGGQSDKARTVLGMPAVGAAAPKAKQPVQAAAVQPSPEGSPPADDPKKARTMLGMAPVIAQPSAPKSSRKPPMAVLSGSQPAPAAQPVAAKAQPVAAKAQPVAAKAQPVAAKPQSAAGTAQSAAQNRTMLGMAAMVDAYTQDQKAPVTEETRKEPSSVPAQASRTEETPSPAEQQAPVKTAVEPDEEPKPKTAAPVDRTPADRQEDPRSAHDAESRHDWLDEEEQEPRRKSSGLLVAAIVAGIVVVIIGIVAVLYLAQMRSDGGIESQVFPTADGKGIMVAFSLPDAPAGATIEAAGETVPVLQGQARVVIAMSSLKLGKNEITAVYRQPGESPSERVLPIFLRHNVTTDFSGLALEPPHIMVNFQIAPDIGLALDGKKVPLSNGLYNHKMLLSDIMKVAEKSGDNLMLRLTFQLVDAQGKAEQGQQVIPIPMTNLQIDRPASGVQVASDSITCAGQTESGAQVTVNGQPVGVTSAGFNTTVPLPQLGEHEIKIVAKVGGKSPRTQTVSVTRIESLKSAIEEWSKDLDKRLDYPKIGRDPNAHLDKKVKLSGRIVNISTERGVTAFLLYIAEGCPAGARCAIYVVFRGETDAGLQSWVDIYGRVKGTRGVDLPSGSKLDVPAVEAAFVTEKVQSKRGKRRR